MILDKTLILTEIDAQNMVKSSNKDSRAYKIWNSPDLAPKLVHDRRLPTWVIQNLKAKA